MRVLGFDPGLRKAGVVIADESRVLAVRAVVADSEGAFRGIHAADAMIEALTPIVQDLIDTYAPQVGVVECPVDYGFNRRADPNDLLCLGLVSGCVLTLLGYNGVAKQPVYPRDWKGQEKKRPNQSRSLALYGWKFRKRGNPSTPVTIMGIPADVDQGDGIPVKAHSEIADALGMAVWGLTKKRRRKRFEGF